MAETYPNVLSNGEISLDSPTMSSSSQNSPMGFAGTPGSFSGITGAGSSSSGPGPTPGTSSATASGGGTSTNTGSATTPKVNTTEVQPILTKARLQELVREVDPTEQLDEEVEELLLQIADDFIEDTVKAACLYAKHRKVSKVEIKDVQLHLERKWNMWIPGFGTDELKPYKRASITEAHKQRLALIRKTIKKY